MATWKEKGVVPDSDDEDSLDSQSNTGFEDPTTEERHEDLHGQEDDNDENHEDLNIGATGDGILPATNHTIYERLNKLSTKATEKIPTDSHGRTPSSPVSSAVFKDPRTIWSFEEDDISHAESEASLPKLMPHFAGGGLPRQDEVSHSYVRLTSPMSSLLSSLPESLDSLAPQPRNSNGKDGRGARAEENVLQSYQHPVGLGRRSLRQRNAIQLHPYIVEQERYRRTLKARGMTPMRLAQTLEERQQRSRDASSPAPETESQDVDSQEADSETEESQQPSIDRHTVPRSPRDKSVSEDDSDVAPSTAKDDDEFPDIDDLLQGKNPVQRRVDQKRRMHTYSKRPQLSKEHARPPRYKRPQDDPDSIFNVPASPPATSSPLPSITKRAQKAVSGASSNSSQDPTPSWLAEDELGFQLNTNPLTPATSAVKPGPEPVLVETGSEDDPFASEPGDSPEASFSDESVEIRKVGKRIRGVLPASHLRLDQHLKKLKIPDRTQRQSLTASPMKQPRRGIALPKSPGQRRSPPTSTRKGLPIFSDDSEEGDEDVDENHFTMAEDDITGIENLYPQQREGYAEEDDRIDEMLPSEKRRRSGLDNWPRKRRRKGSPSYSCQPKITEHLMRTRKRNQSSKGGIHRSRNRRPQRLDGHRRPQKSPPPRLSILDFTGSVSQDVPQFIKVAARTVRSKRNLGRQSPSKKFIRLANREDTADAQSVLQDWQDGKIKPRDFGPSANGIDASRAPLRRISSNGQTRLPLPMAMVKSRMYATQLKSSSIVMPRKLVISKRNQRSMNDFVTTKFPPQDFQRRPTLALGWKAVQKHGERQHYLGQSRPAQLESSDADLSSRHPTSAFGTTKKALDSLYRHARKRQAPQMNLQLNRFLIDDDDFLKPSIEIEEHLEKRDSNPVSKIASSLQTAHRRRKRPPQRLDAGAAVYRQPSEPMVLEIRPLQNGNPKHENKLLGLGKFGTKYSVHYDIFHLQGGIFFHESTFLGSGRLAAVIRSQIPTYFDTPRSSFTFQLGEKEFWWGPWDANVSSEIGLCFDWLFDQLSPVTSPQLGHEEPIDIVTTIIVYLQHHISFTTNQARNEFLSRISEIMTEFSSRLSPGGGFYEEKRSQYRIEAISRCMVLSLQLLRVARDQTEDLSLISKMEDLLLGVANTCIKMLLLHGLDDVRKLYDDLQYLSFRERGIRATQFAAQAWVVAFRTLNAARIPKKSFWDVANKLILEENATTIVDAPTMEKTWYSMFSLLPLWDFDEYGVIVPNPSESESFVNWSLPQQMLKRVFELYSLNSRQSPGFNNYCRTIVSRCHFLMLEWGWWKCSSIIGTIFDFFALQKLFHLRNEEVFKSPRFLEELDIKPSLEIEPEDRCFHIFLKIVALAIKQLRQAGDEKGIRNLVARVLPNHDRQHLREDDSDDRDRAAIRNHHDLLCTLFWAAPPNQRPQLTLIQDLVVPDRSHNALCMINLRAWNQLARFVLSSPSPSTSFRPLIKWQSTFFAKIFDQYVHLDSNTRRQVDVPQYPVQRSILEEAIQDFVDKNRESTVPVLRTVLENIHWTVAYAKDGPSLMEAFNHDSLAKLLDARAGGIFGKGDSLITRAIEIVKLYMGRIDFFHPREQLGAQAAPATFQEDSQDSFDMNLNMERQVLIFPLCDKLLPGMFSLTQQILTCGLYQDKEPPYMKILVECWGRLAGLVIEETFNLKDFLPGGPKAVFTRRRGSARANKYWPLFLHELLLTAKIKQEPDGFDVGLEWMLIIALPSSEPLYKRQLSNSLFQWNRLVNFAPVLEERLQWSPAEDSLSIRLIRGALKHMRGSLQSSNPGTSKQSQQNRYSIILKEMMDAIQCELESMMPGSTTHNQYLDFAQKVISLIRSQASNIQPLTRFFINPSIHYWPEESDPTLYAAGIISYALKLRDQMGRTSSELFHYLYRGWRRNLITGPLQTHMGYVRTGMKHWDFVEFMLINYVPAALHVGFNLEAGWIVASAYLPLLANRVPRLLEKGGPQASATFGHVVNILKIIMNGFIERKLRWESNIKGVHAKNRGITAVACQFWLAVTPSMKGYAADYPSFRGDFNDVAERLNTFAQLTIRYLDGGVQEDWITRPFEITEGPQVKNFVKMIEEDIRNNWLFEEIDVAMDSGAGWISILDLAPTERASHRVDLSKLWGRPLHEVLEIGSSEYETGYPCPRPDSLLDKSSCGYLNMFF